MVVSSVYLGFPGLGLEESGSSGKTHPHVVSGGIKCVRDPKALGVVRVSGALSYGVLLASA
jgi:hypothetical protein